MPELEINNFVDFQGELFPISGDLLSILSMPFRESCSAATDHLTPYRILSIVARTSVIAFLKPFQKNPIEITPQNARELLILCDEFQLSSYRRRIEQFLCSHGENLLISSLSALSKEGKDTSGLEAALHSRFPDFSDLLDSLDSVEPVQLATLPLPILSRIVTFPHPAHEEAFRRVFEFCLRVFDFVGPRASILFRSLDLRHLNRNYLHLLRERPTFDWTFLNSSFCDTLFDCQSHYDLLALAQKQLEEDSHNTKVIISEIETRLKGVENRQDLFAQQSEIESVQLSLDSLVNIGFESRIALIESSNSHKGRIGFIQIDCSNEIRSGIVRPITHREI
jgi:hypothetical protein